MFSRFIWFTLLFYSQTTVEMALLKYDFIIRTIPSNPDGYPRPVVIMHHANSSWDIDRPFPGPLIRAKLGDRIQIRITNMLRDQSTSLHFHGFHMFKNPWADGVEHITQCPVNPYTSFIQEFNVTQSGTFWYHSHSAQQYADGLVGPIIIDNDSIEKRYAYGSSDHVIMFQEWYHETWSDLMTAYQGPFGAYQGNIPIYPWPPTTFLINGHGRFDCRTTNCTDPGTWTDVCGRRQLAQCIPLREPFLGLCKREAHPIDEFQCSFGKQMRLRLINAASGIPFRFWIEQHNLTIVARDSIEVVPITVPHINIPIGQRIDVIIQCNQNLNRNYTMFAASRNSFQPSHIITGPTPTMWTTAILTYDNSSTIMNGTNQIFNESKSNPDSSFFEYEYLKPLVSRRALPAVRRVTLTSVVLWNNRTGIDALEEWAINGITFKPPKEPLLLANYFDGTLDNAIAEQRSGRVGNIHATHVVNFEYGYTYEILMINDDPQQHPWHIHGYTVDFIAAGRLPTIEPVTCNSTARRIENFDYNTILPPLNSTPPVLTVGDSFNMPRDSYVAFRFTANNPGPWYLHCHMEWHISPGLSVVLSVGKNGQYRDFIDPPYDNFNMCGTSQQWAMRQIVPKNFNNQTYL
ncbi:unnamed protein product [Rotaria sordida]|uniref:Laccase n=1 Tax=Rotaria sordida TaxID=392033 RepID=A0A819UMA0_9BILA|nr:unnamed protein product [Rotaria sordida]CAF1416680.1 unnamed protein product [Rotaria sordida]CAF3929177.1 unnamed protein product [Rotaria sordida]CAF4097643.1 unnamed protein product [Rotaria sordida]